MNIKPGDGLIYSSTNRLSSLMLTYQITKFMGPTWGPPGSCRPQMGPMLALWALLSGLSSIGPKKHVPCSLVVLLLLSIITDLLRLCFIISYIYVERERAKKPTALASAIDMFWRSLLILNIHSPTRDGSAPPGTFSPIMDMIFPYTPFVWDLYNQLRMYGGPMLEILF